MRACTPPLGITSVHQITEVMRHVGTGDRLGFTGRENLDLIATDEP